MTPIDRDRCLFCRIADGAVPSRTLFGDEQVCAFHDVNPRAPAHVLLIPRRHIASLDDLTPEDEGLVGHLVRCATDLARQLGYGERGYRLVWNCGPEAGQSVFHIHLHLLAGRRLGWPPG
jgi:histidine triad (HIT) family protein